MKKHLVLGALAVLALAACTKSEVVELNKGNEISLTAVTGKNLTKAQDGYCNSSLPSDFQVWASTTTDPKVYFKNETYTLSSGTYKSATAHYWPAQNLDFFAAKNHNCDVTFNPSAAVPFKFTGYTVNSTVSAQTDFIYAVNKNQAKATPATLNFRHALSQIEFKAKNSNSSIRVFIDGIKVANVKSKGNFEVTGETDRTVVDHDHAFDPLHPDSDPRATESRGKWTYPTPIVTDSYSVTFAEKEVASGSTVDLTYSSGEYNPNSMYLLPQSLTVWDGSGKANDSSDAYFIVNALIYNVADPSATFNKADNVVLWGTNDGSGNWSTKPIAVKIPAGQTWEDGKRYVYTFNFSTYGTGGTDPSTGDPVLTPIELTVSVDDFVDVAENVVDVQ